METKKDNTKFNIALPIELKALFGRKKIRFSVTNTGDIILTNKKVMPKMIMANYDINRFLKNS